MKRILIYDDEIVQCEELKKMLMNNCDESFQIHIATTYTEAKQYLSKFQYDMLFIDIELDYEINGISFVSDLNIASKTNLIYITAHILYCEEIFTTSPDALILKPFSHQKIKRVLDIIKEKDSDNFYLNLNLKSNRIERVNLENISYIENIRRKLTFFDNAYNVVYEFYGIKISDIENRMPKYFVRCHHSILVNFKYVKNIGRYFFIMTNGRELSISQPKFKNVREKYMEYLGDCI